MSDNEKTKSARSTSGWVIAGVCLLSGLFLTQCVHVACMTGVVCIPYIGLSEQMQSSLDSAGNRRSYRASLNPLQLAIADGQLETQIVAVMGRFPEQMNTSSDGTVRTIDLAVLHNRPEIVRRLLAAGVDGFAHDAGDQKTARDTPFARALTQDYLLSQVAGQSPQLLIDAFLETGKLDANSEDAQWFLENAIGNQSLFDRLVAYGIKPSGSYEQVDQAARNGSLATLAFLLKVNPNRAGWTAAHENSVVLSALSGCNFDRAHLLLDAGIAIRQSDPEHAGPQWIETIVKNCAGLSSWRAPPETRNATQLAARSAFLDRLAKMKVNVNAKSHEFERCPSWLTHQNGFACGPSADPDLRRKLLSMGADPYSLFDVKEPPAVFVSWTDCAERRPGGLFWEMLASPPRGAARDDHRGTSRALADMLTAVGRPSVSSCPDTTDQDVYPAATVLLSYGADIDAPNSRGDTALHWLLDQSPMPMERLRWVMSRGASLDTELAQNEPAAPLRADAPGRAELIRQLEAMRKR